MKKRLFASLLALCFVLVNTLSTPFTAFDQEFLKGKGGGSGTGRAYGKREKDRGAG